MGVLSTGQHPGLTGSAGTAQKRLRGEAQGERGVSMPARARTGEQVPTPWYRACSENKRYCGGAPALRRVAPSARMADPISDDEPGMADAKRRKQPSQAVAPIAAPNAPAAWPSSSELYANGLEHRAAAAPQAAPGQTWTVSGQSWRNEHMSQSDADGSVLRQRQQEARRAMLQRR